MSQVLEKAIRLIDVVAAGEHRLNEIAASAGLTRSTAHRLLATLVEGNYLAFEDRRYILGFRLLELGETKRRSLQFTDQFRPILRRYSEETGDTIHLAALDGDSIVLLDAVHGNRQLRINSFAGLRNAAYMTAVGKVLISQLPERKWHGFIGELPAGYRVTAAHILEEIRQASLRNAALDYDECNVGTCGVAASFTLTSGVRLACSINGATVYFGDGRLERLIPVAQRLAAELQAAHLGDPSSADAGLAMTR